MRKVFIDCGTGHGEGLVEHIKNNNIDSEWEIFTFEANPHTFSRFVENLTIFKNINLNGAKISYKNIAVWIEDCKKTLYPEGLNVDSYHNNVKVKTYIDSLNKNFSDNLSPRNVNINVPDFGGSMLFNPNTLDRKNMFQEVLCKFYDPIEVDAFNFCNWLRDNFNHDDYILIKMDIEGSEYDVLEQCIKEDVLKIINCINVEFHSWQLQNKNALIIKEQKIKEYCAKNKIIINGWK
jgi:FkbM family methyltransferase